MNNLSAWRQDDELSHIIDSLANGDFTDMNSTIEIRGDFQVTIYPDHEMWQLRYVDGTFGRECRIEGDDTTLERCKVCDRRWAGQDRNIQYDNADGRMICPDCQNK